MLISFFGIEEISRKEIVPPGLSVSAVLYSDILRQLRKNMKKNS